MKTERLFLMDIETGERLRAIDPARVSAIQASIAEIGLRTPLTVLSTKDGDEWRFRLVAGAHRLEALRASGEEYADCFIMEGGADDAALWEIDENLIRAELTDAQRADHHARRRDIMVKMGMVATQAQGRSKQGQLGPVSYAAKTAKSLGVGERTVKRDLARGTKIVPEVLASVMGTTLDKGVTLDKLASTPAAEQAAMLARMQAEPKRSVVRLAPDPFNDSEAHEKQLSALMSAWNRAAAVVRQEFLLRIDEPVFDQTAAGAA